jgi:hypothetical protein
VRRRLAVAAPGSSGRGALGSGEAVPVARRLGGTGGRATRRCREPSMEATLVAR